MSEDAPPATTTISLETILRLKRHELMKLYGDPPVIHPTRMKEYQQLDEEILELERQIAREKGEEYAVEWHLLDYDAFIAKRIRAISDDSRCFLVLDSNVVVYFNRVISYRFEGISDKAFEGHRLAGHGLAYWETFVIENSRWLSEVQNAHKRNPDYHSEQWQTMRHYLLFFKERVFEALCSEPPTVIPHISFEEGIQRALAALDK